MRGVDVNRGVGDNVGDGANVCVAVADSKPVIGMTDCEVCVNPATMVCATMVLMAFESGVETTGKAQARDAINRTATDKRIGLDLSMFPPFG